MNANFDILNEHNALLCVCSRTKLSSIGYIYNLLSEPVGATVSILSNFQPLTVTC
jgi:hypothetical protein